MPDRQRGDHHERDADFARVGLADPEAGLRGHCTGDCCGGRGADQPPRRLTYRRRTHPARPAGERANREEGGKHAEEGGVLRGGAIPTDGNHTTQNRTGCNTFDDDHGDQQVQ